MNPALEYHQLQTRRQFFEGAGLKVGGVALAQLLGQRGLLAKEASAGGVHPALPGFPHFSPKAKNLIYLHMNGAPAQMDLFDYKPEMDRFFDQELPASVRNNQRITTMTSGQVRFPVAPSKFAFERCGQSGILMSELVPHMKEIADDVTMIKSVHTDAINHDPACTFVMTGSEVPGKPSLGSWLSYGLGSESQDLPAFVVFTPTFPKASQAQALFTRMWSSGFLPSQYDGVALRGAGDPVLFVKNPPGVNPGDRRVMLDALGKLGSSPLSLEIRESSFLENPRTPRFNLTRVTIATDSKVAASLRSRGAAVLLDGASDVQAPAALSASSMIAISWCTRPSNSW